MTSEADHDREAAALATLFARAEAVRRGDDRLAVLEEMVVQLQWRVRDLEEEVKRVERHLGYRLDDLEAIRR